jgi:nitrogen fixation protein
MKNRFYLLSLIFLMAGCAGVEVTEITSKNPYKEGVRFYRPWPYLLVTKDEDGKFQTKNIYLPKMNEEYVINVKSGMGTVEASFTLTDGWQLTQLGDKRDSKIPETIGAITGAATGLKTVLETTKAPGPAKAKSLPSPGLYRYEFDNNGLVTGLIPVLQFEE